MTDKKKEIKISKFKQWILKWKSFDFPSYRDDFSPTVLYWLLAVTALMVLFYVPIKSFLNLVLIHPIISFCPVNIGADLVFGIFLIISVVIFLHRISKYVVPTINSLCISITIIVLYFVFFKTDNAYNFYHFSVSFANNICYASIFLLSIVLSIFSYKSYLLPLVKQPSKFSLLDDFPSTEKYQDVYSRSSYADVVAGHIINTSTDASFAIGIIGDWGSGKSDFLIRLKNALRGNGENIIFDFNPWRVNKADAIIEEFFKTLSRQLKPYNQSIVSTINNYSGRVLKSARETQLKLVDALINGGLQEDDIQEKYETINQSIKATSKRIVIFIDDVDRLTGKEVMEVLRIIRNTANFANTFFVVGIDQNYIVSVLKNTKDFTNEDEYLKKVFQLTITLPAFKKDIFVSEIKRNLFTPDVEEIHKKKIQVALSLIAIDSDDHESGWFSTPLYHEFLLEKMIETIRDLKRFCNSFKIVFNILKDEAEISDLIVLELIRNKNILVYNSIRNRKILTTDMDNPDHLKLDRDKWEKLQEQILEDERAGLSQALEYLFTDKQTKNQKKLLLAHNFYIYFSYQLFGLISFHKFNETLEKTENEIFETFSGWIKAGKDKELSQIFKYIEDFKDANELKKIVIVLLKLWYPNSDWFEHAKILIFINWQYNHERYFQKNKLKHKEFLCSILSDVNVERLTRAQLASQFLKAIIDKVFNESELFITKKELRNTIYNLFDDYLKSNPSDPYKSEEFYHLNDYKVVHGLVNVFPPVNKLYKKYLLSNDNGFKNYIKVLLRPYQTSYDGYFVFEPYLKQIFPKRNEFEERLINMNFSEPEMSKLKEIIINYMNDYFASGGKAFEIKDENEREFIEQYLALKLRNN